MEEAIFKFDDVLQCTCLHCNKCDSIIKTGKQFNDAEINAARGRMYLPEQHCKKCLIEDNKIIVSLPISLSGNELVNIDVVQDQKVIGHISVHHDVWKKMDKERQKDKNTYSKHYLLYNINKIEWV